MVQQVSFLMIAVALILAIINWVSVAKKWRKIEFITKPGVILALISWLIVNGGYQGYLLFFLIGLVFSLVGDIYFMLPKGKFLAGLVFFLFTNIAYTIGFNNTISQFSIAGLILLILVGMNALLISRHIISELVAQGDKNLRIPVIVYTFAIMIMVVSAYHTLIRPNAEWKPFAAIIVSFGATCFFLSDSLLAWNKFVTQTPHASILIMITYHLAQITIIFGAGINYLT
jgi:uncharacterized membrane protein YhhN